MKLRSNALRLSALLLVAMFGAHRASADIINFQNFTGPSDFENPEQTLTFTNTSAGTVTISGGTVLTGAVGAVADETSIYATCAVVIGCPAGYSNTLTITFSTAISNFFLTLYNGQNYADTFTASDNAGETVTDTIAPYLSAGSALITFPAAGTQVTVTTADPNYDFAIDNIGFNQANTSPTPEPGTMTLLATGVAALGGLLWHRRRLASGAMTAAA